MQETKFIWLDGEFVPWKNAMVHFLTHSLHYGTGVFEGIRCYETGKGPAVFRLSGHVERLFDSAGIAGMKGIPFSQEQIVDATKELVRKNGARECYIRPLFYYGYGKMGLDTKGAKISAGIALWPWGAYLGEKGMRNGVSAMVSSVRRQFSKPQFAHAKITGAYASSTFAKMEALEKGFEEAIMLDAKGNVAECSGENIFIVKGGKVLTPTKDFVLAGITRDSIMRLAESLGYPVSATVVTKEMLFSADECFITGTAAEVTPIRAVGKKPIGSGKPGNVTKELQEAYSDAVHGRLEKFSEWLELV